MALSVIRAWTAMMQRSVFQTVGCDDWEPVATRVMIRGCEQCTYARAKATLKLGWSFVAVDNNLAGVASTLSQSILTYLLTP